MHLRAFDGWMSSLTLVALGHALLGCNRTDAGAKPEPSAAAVEHLTAPTPPAPTTPPAVAPPAGSASAGASDRKSVV